MNVQTPGPLHVVGLAGALWASLAGLCQAQREPRVAEPPALALPDADHDGLADGSDPCPSLSYHPGFGWQTCGPMDLDPDNDALPECRARERVAHLLMTDSAFITHIAFAVVKDGRLHFADAFEYLGGGEWARNPGGIYRLYRVGSTSKAVTAVTAKIMEERGELSFGDFVNDDDGTQEFDDPQRTLRDLLSHRAFHLDSGAIHLFCYSGDLGAFWADPDDLVSPHYDSPPYGNPGGGFEYSAFNYSLAGAYIACRAGQPFAQAVQSRLFDATGMCTASFDGTRAVGTPIGNGWGLSETNLMHVGPYINYYSIIDQRCEDNFYSSDDLPGDEYSWEFYHLDEASAPARDPAGGVIASVLDLGHFAEALLDSYRNPGGLVSQEGIRELWTATHDFGCGGGCAYQPYYGIGFFTNSATGQNITEVEHGGSRAGYQSAFVIRPEANTAACILVNADTSTVTLSRLAKQILDDFE